MIGGYGVVLRARFLGRTGTGRHWNKSKGQRRTEENDCASDSSDSMHNLLLKDRSRRQYISVLELLRALSLLNVLRVSVAGRDGPNHERTKNSARHRWPSLPAEPFAQPTFPLFRFQAS